MRIVQLIDSLEAGGAERMAVNYANALAGRIAFSGLVSTRSEGPLLAYKNKNVAYCHLHKKNAFDVLALFRLRSFLVKNQVGVLQAHSTSFFTAFLVKLLYPKLRLIWHDHYGDSEFLRQRPDLILKMTMPFFSRIISVNQQLKIWAEKKFKTKNAIYLPNFAKLEDTSSEKTILKGTEGKRIICLANLREQKDHFLLLDVARLLKESHPDWTFHLVGKDFNDNYSANVKLAVSHYGLSENVFLYGSKSDVGQLLKMSSIAILTSKSEGLPVALLEYGLCSMPVVVTAVGEIPNVVTNNENGILVASGQSSLFHESIVAYIENNDFKERMGKSLYHTILEGYSENAILNQYLSWVE